MSNDKPLLTLEEIETLIGRDPSEDIFGPAGAISLPSPPVSLILETLGMHEHVALIPESELEAERFARAFLLAGLKAGQLCLAVLGGQLLEMLSSALEPAVVEAAPGELPGRLLLLDEARVAPNGPLDLSAMLAILESEPGARERGLRLVREPAGRYPAGLDAPRLAEEEARVRQVLGRGRGMIGLNLFDRNMSPSLLKAVIATHHYVSTKGRLAKNLCAVPPGAYLRVGATDIEVRRMLKKVEEGGALARKASFLERVLGRSAPPFAAVWPDGRLMTFNDPFLGLLGLDRQAARFLSLDQDLAAPEWRENVSGVLAELLRSRREQRLDLALRRPDGGTVEVSAVLDLALGNAGTPEFVYGFFLERGEATRSFLDAGVRSIGSHSAGRASFMTRVALSLAKAKRHEEHRFTLMVMRVEPSGTAGPELRTELAQASSRRLEKSVRAIDAPAMIDADRQALLLDGVTDGRQAMRIARRIRGEVCRPFRVGGQDVSARCSIGMVVASADYDAPGQILRDAGQALLKGGSVEIFDSLQHDEAVKFLQLEDDLRRGLSCGELFLNFQPVVDLADRSIRGFEALARWSHPERGLLLPDEFIPVAEASGLIHVLEPWAMRTACEALVRWLDLVGESHSLFVSVNVSGLNFLRLGFIASIDDILRDTGLSPRRLKIEIREDAAARDPVLAKSVADVLASREIDLFFDDYGSGASSMTMLHNLPLDGIKIDSSRLPLPGMAGSIVAVARKLDLAVVFEGLERDEELAGLTGLSGDLGQGFLFSRPMGWSEAAGLLTPVIGRSGPHPASP